MSGPRLATEKREIPARQDSEAMLIASFQEKEDCTNNDRELEEFCG